MAATFFYHQTLYQFIQWQNWYAEHLGQNKTNISW